MIQPLLILLIILLAGLVGIKTANTYIQNKQPIENEQENVITEMEPIVEEKEVQIFNGNTRPIAVMIDNVGDARPQAGLNDAYIVYEIIVEGNLTRLMALYKDVELDKIGPIRSSRHYFLDYALENDAIYVHFGWSPKAQSDISSLKVNNINGMAESSKSFWRVRDKRAPHNAVTSTEKILEIAKRKGYKTTSEKESRPSAYPPPLQYGWCNPKHFQRSRFFNKSRVLLINGTDICFAYSARVSVTSYAETRNRR